MKTTRYQYTVIYEPAEEGGYIARIPFLNDLTTQGETLEEAKLMAKDAIECYIGGLLKDRLPIPREKRTGFRIKSGMTRVFQSLQRLNVNEHPNSFGWDN